MSENMKLIFRSNVTGSGVPVVHYQCDFLDKGGHTDPTKGAKWMPQDTRPLLFSAEKAAEELGCQLMVVDVNGLGFMEKLKERLSGNPLPRLVIGSRTVTGFPTKKEIVKIYREVCK
jgi:hypothetical protein